MRVIYGISICYCQRQMSASYLFPSFLITFTVNFKDLDGMSFSPERVKEKQDLSVSETIMASALLAFSRNGTGEINETNGSEVSTSKCASATSLPVDVISNPNHGKFFSGYPQMNPQQHQ